jgi:hypothetical protein
LIKNDQGGLASLLGRSNVSHHHYENSEQQQQYEQQEHDAQQQHQQEYDTQHDKQQYDHQQQQQRFAVDGGHPIPSGKSPSSHSSVGGIGSLLEQTMSSHITNMKRIIHHQQDDDEQFRNMSTTPIFHRPLTSSEEMMNHDPGDNVQELSRSLTGLSILKTSPRGMLELDPEGREAIASMRSRSHSGEVVIGGDSGGEVGGGGKNLFLKKSVKDNAMIPSIPLICPTVSSSEKSAKEKQVVTRGFSNASDDHSQVVAMVEGNHSGENESDEFFNLDM